MTEPAPPAWLASFTAATVKAALGVPVTTAQDDAWLDKCVAWVASYATAAQTSNKLTDAAVLWAAHLHAMRLFNRRGSSGAASASFDAGAAGDVATADADLVLAYRANYPRLG